MKAGAPILRAAVLTLTEQGSCGQGGDASDSPLTSWLAGRGVETVRCATISDKVKAIAATLAEWADSGDIDLILTTGGTCAATSEVIRTGTLGILEREIPEFGEVMRVTSLTHDPHSMLNLGVAGVRWRSLIVNLPGNPTLAVKTLEALWPLIQHRLPTVNSELEEWTTAAHVARVAGLKVVSLQGPGVERSNLLEMVSVELRGRGWQVGAMRHDAVAEGLEIDHPGKESLAAYFGNVDIVLTEGFRQSDVPTIAVHAGKVSALQAPSQAAEASDHQSEGDRPVFEIEDIAGIATLIENLTGTEVPPACELSFPRRF
jgi:molybdopterin adenylyltransferase